jgi:hypothetical protein
MKSKDEYPISNKSKDEYPITNTEYPMMKGGINRVYPGM